MSVLETVTFKLQDGVSDADFAAVTATLERDFMQNLSGYRSRTTARTAEGEWLVIVEWASSEDADAGAAAFPGSEQGQAYLGKLDPATLAFSRYEVLDPAGEA